MSPFLISLMFTAGAATWLYTKFQRYNGNNTQQSAIAAAVSAAVIFFVFYMILRLII